ncbi:hypothetical protein EV426DRAFT_678780 [Tirmania nivea]|nr:hypothetical protein EV426DRAFT_678780 [Tirmania nivea]
MTCTVVTNGTFPWWDLPALLSWYHRVYPSPSPPVSLSCIQYYQLFRHTFSLPSSMWLLTSRASPIVLPKTLYPANTPTISLYTRISYIDFQANIMELRFHPRTINELRRAYDYFLDKSYALRMYNTQLKTALRGRFLYRLESWVEKIGCEAIKAATREDIGCGDLGAWCEGMVNWEAEEVENLKTKKGGGNGQPGKFITEGEQVVINRYAEIMGVSLGEKQGGKERGRSQNKKLGVVEYVKAGFVPCLEEAQDIWRMTFKVPEGWVWASYPELSPLPSPGRQIPSTPCLKQKFPGLCQSLGVATPTTGNHSGRIRERKACPSAPSNARLASINREGGKRKRSKITTGATNRTAVGSRRPSSMVAYQAGTEWYLGISKVDVRAGCWDAEKSTWTGTCSGDCSICTTAYEDEGTLTSKRVSALADSEDEESPMDLETPRSSAPATAEIVALQPLPRAEAATSTPAFWPPHPYSAGQETAPPQVRAHSPADPADTRVLTAAWDQQIKVVQNQHQGLPSSRIPHRYSPLSYMKHRTRRFEARKIAALQRGRAPEQTAPAGATPRRHVKPVAPPTSPAGQGANLNHPPSSPSWYMSSSMSPGPASERVEEWVEYGNVCVGVRQKGREGGPIAVPSSPFLPAQKLGLYPTPPADEEGEEAACIPAASTPILLISSSP